MNFRPDSNILSMLKNPPTRWIVLSESGLRISLILFLFSLPLAYITAIREITFVAALFFWFLTLVLNRKDPWYLPPLFWPLMAWVAVAFFSLIWAVDPAYSFKEIRGEILKCLVVYFLVQIALTKDDGIKQVYLTLIISNILMVTYGILDFYTLGGNLREFVIRARSLHSGYGAFGTYLITIFPFLIIGFFSPLLKKERWIIGGLSLFNLFCIYISFGRAMWLAVMIEMAAVVFMFKKKQFLLILGLGLLVLFFFIPRTVLFHGEKLPSPGESTPQAIGGTGGDLIDVWKLSLDRLREKPFQGIGFGRYSFSEAFTDFRARHQPLLWHAHNTFLNIFFQTGLQGLVIFLWLVISILFVLFQRSKDGISSWPGLISLATGIMVIGFFTRNLFDDFYIDDNALLFWFLVGAALFKDSRGTNQAPK